MQRLNGDRYFRDFSQYIEIVEHKARFLVKLKVYAINRKPRKPLLGFLRTAGSTTHGLEEWCLAFCAS